MPDQRWLVLVSLQLFFFQYNYLEERKEHNMSQQVYPQINRVVQTESGALRGVPAGIPQYTVFKGVPYAAPPVGNLRWKEPQPVIPWKGVRDARALDRLLLSIEILWVLCTGTSFIAAPNPWMRTVSISTYGRRPLPMMKNACVIMDPWRSPDGRLRL